MYGPDSKTGKEFKTMEIKFTRKNNLYFQTHINNLHKIMQVFNVLVNNKKTLHQKRFFI